MDKRMPLCFRFSAYTVLPLACQVAKIAKFNVVAYCGGAACGRPSEDAEQQIWHGQDFAEFHQSVLLCWSTVSLALNLNWTLTF